MKFDERRQRRVLLAAAAAILLMHCQVGNAQTRPIDVATEQPAVWHEIATQYATGIAFSPDGRFFAETSRKSVRVWSIYEKRLINEFDARNYAHSPVFTPDSSEIVVADGVGNLEYRSTLHAWSLSQGTASELGHCMGVVHDLKFNSDGSRLAAVSSFNPIGSIVHAQESRDKSVGEILVWRVGQQGDPLQIPCLVDELPKRGNDAHYALIEKVVPMHLAFNSDGSRLATVTRSGGMKVFDTDTGEQKADVKASGCVRFRDDGKIETAEKIYDDMGVLVKERSGVPWRAVAGNYAVETGDFGQISVRNLSRPQESNSFSVPPEFSRLAVSSDGRFVAVILAKKVVLWRLDGKSTADESANDVQQAAPLEP